MKTNGEGIGDMSQPELLVMVSSVFIVLVRLSDLAVKVRHEHEELQGEAEVTALFEHS